MKKISYAFLQKKYPRKIVVLDKNETKVVAEGKDFTAVFQKLKRINADPKNYIFVGPIQKQGTINVYISIRN
jgi:hypothetical protein